MADRFYIHQFENGLTLLTEPLDHVVSTAVTITLPAGAGRDAPEMAGAAGVLSQWLLRGAAGRDNRALNDALEALGCHHDELVGSALLRLSASQTHQNLDAVLALHADIVRRPTLADETFDPCRDLALLELAGLEDEPTRKCNLRLAEQFYPRPWGVSALGTTDSLTAMTPAAVRDGAAARLRPAETIVAIAGRIDPEPLRDTVAELFGDWAGPMPPEPATTSPGGGITHETKQTAQVQIALAYPAPRLGEEHYYPMRVAEMILSGGMSGRLFTEVREKRGLVYSVGARYQGMRAAAGIFVYAGTAPERAQETLDVTIAEIRRLAEGVSDDELARAKTQLKAALIMAGESTAARVGGLVNDWRLLGRLRTLDEIAAAVDTVTAEQVLACVAAYPPENMTAYFIGPEPLDTACLRA